eukprot:TRINITY_DN1694_c0_g1_i4.p1 TRINITY_DN1694_c0_g1~~TRINITY_DN1694_c0_g1_i4.p1  ORF type:complete len:885 (-),score=222.95 TRINITY_DN1694_c0_g1_i4:151-2805(-)
MSCRVQDDHCSLDEKVSIAKLIDLWNRLDNQDVVNLPNYQKLKSIINSSPELLQRVSTPQLMTARSLGPDNADDINYDSLTTIPASVLAKQLSLYVNQMVNNIPINEFLNDSLSPEKRNRKAKNVCKLIDFGKQLKGIVNSYILTPQPLSNQIATFRYFMNVSYELMFMNNYFAMKYILQALKGAAVSNLIPNFFESDKEIEVLGLLAKMSQRLSEIETNDDWISKNVSGTVPVVYPLSWKHMQTLYNNNQKLRLSCADDKSDVNKDGNETDEFSSDYSDSESLPNEQPISPRNEDLDKNTSEHCDDTELINWSVCSKIARSIILYRQPYRSNYNYKTNKKVQNLIESSPKWLHKKLNYVVSNLIKLSQKPSGNSSSSPSFLNDSSLQTQLTPRFVGLKTNSDGNLDIVGMKRISENNAAKFSQTFPIPGINNFSVPFNETQFLDSTFNELTKSDWALILAATGAQEEEYLEGEVILKPGANQTFLYRLCEGRVKMAKRNKSIKPDYLEHLNIFGEIQMLLNKTIPSSYIADDDDVKVYKIDRLKLMKLCVENTEISRKFNYYMASKAAGRLKRKLENLTTMTFSSDQMPTKSENASERHKRLFSSFHLNEEETLLKEYPCQVVKSLTKSVATLYVSEHHFFYQTKKAFGFGMKEITEISNVTKLTIKGNKIKIGEFGIFKFPTSTINSVFEFLNEIWVKETKNSSSSSSSSSPLPPSPTSSSSHLSDSRNKKSSKNINTPTSSSSSLSLSGTLFTGLSESEWQLILEGSYVLNFKQGDKIFEKGDHVNRLYHLRTGKIAIVSETENKYIIDANAKDPVFDEIAIFQEKAGYTLEAEEDNTSLVVLEFYYLAVLFYFFPEMQGKFFYYLASTLCQKLEEVGYIS